MLRLRRATHAAVTGQQASLQPDGEQDAGCIRQADTVLLRVCDDLAHRRRRGHVLLDQSGVHEW